MTKYVNDPSGLSSSKIKSQRVVKPIATWILVILLIVMMLAPLIG